MTVDELIQLLAKHPPDLRVMLDGYEGGVDDLEPHFVLTSDVHLNANTRWYYGRHEEAYAGDRDKGAATVRALVFRRPWHDEE